ncbi:hypothetical protein GKC30_01695 [Pseudodesulfovibrio sp. F-1]|uniref:Glycerol-3-phosphate responsive antiterminator n=1 Tax=Pseudodesulfovibrio alkaliphilus TaxID=2661613 RepID=A0A7K1KKD1_9BACT|nr:glycerol-3-phosphate responsive antiterminator [Pseudodesulfovibrio alkaliphilus]MUM76342.1 hypothetical protein [Pseudodesulfovibrio alkaliphilus]
MDTIRRERVIAAIADLQHVVTALESDIHTVFLLHDNVRELEQAVGVLRGNGKRVFIHFDMVEGLAPNPAGLEHLRSLFSFDGVITTKGGVIRKGKKLGLVTIQRIFMIDSRSIDTAVSAVGKYEPDAVEIMPGLLAKAVHHLHGLIRPPLITGGMISTREEVEMMLATPVAAISASVTGLWVPVPFCLDSAHHVTREGAELS